MSTRRERDWERDDDRYGRERDDRRYDSGGSAYGARRGAGPSRYDDDRGGWSRPAPRYGRDEYAPDEYSFSETGGVFDPGRGGRDYEDRRAREFDARADELARDRNRHRADSSYRADERRGGDYLPGTYGYGGEGRRQAPEAPTRFGYGGAAYGAGFEGDLSRRWERAYEAQGYRSQRGRGPRGYTRSDERILEDVSERLSDDPVVDATEIDVRCESGRIVLEGRVPMRWMKHRAEDIADSISGVTDVDNRVRVVAEDRAARGARDSGAHGAGATADEAGRDMTTSATSGGRSSGKTADAEKNAQQAH